MRNFLFASLLVAATSRELTLKSWDAAVNGKTAVFVMFHVDWCEKCKQVLPRWQKLAKKYIDSDSILVGSVDCINEGKSLCGREGVTFWPKFLYSIIPTCGFSTPRLTYSKTNLKAKPWIP